MFSSQKFKTWTFALKFATKQRYINSFIVSNPSKYKQSMKLLGKWTSSELINLGPTFIKLGQTLSTRTDVFPLEFTSQLEILQDNVDPVNFDYIFQTIENDIGMQHFTCVSSVPFKSASLGQVHKAKLKNGRSVIVKVRRPNIETIMINDTNNISEILSFLNKLLNTS